MQEEAIVLEEESSNKGNKKYQDGDILKFIRVRFPGNIKAHSFLLGNRKLGYGQKVVAMSDRGMAVGYVNSFPYDLPFKKEMLPLKTISKVAAAEDIVAEKKHLDAERKADRFCNNLIEKLKIDMTVTHVEFIQFGKKAVFYFNAPSRVDFRELVKSLVGELKMRVELRQISIRDRAAAIGGIGPCGLQTCCSYFLKDYGNVSIKMVKNQNLALVPSKINGACGQLKCCMKYENEVYSEKRRDLPKEGTFIKAANGDIGKVLRLNVLFEQFEMLTDKGIMRKYAGNQYLGVNSKTPEGWSFPKTFDFINNETAKIIGEEKSEEDEVSSEMDYFAPVEIEASVPEKKEENPDRDRRTRNRRRRRKPKTD
ncbi:MAG: stage 0 sporulation protein [Deltaproteobacteria bacterium]|nr:MAG: stage 0 sporulation protein [Deltaproteobacteria bacterium]